MAVEKGYWFYTIIGPHVPSVACFTYPCMALLKDVQHWTQPSTAPDCDSNQFRTFKTQQKMPILCQLPIQGGMT
eukprot:2555754-Ditylum_brightwellii.AAC.1